MKTVVSVVFLSPLQGKVMLATLLIPMATIKQNPILGTYSTLSATTKPTVKNRLVAGRKGNMVRDSAKVIVCNPFLLIFFNSDFGGQTPVGCNNKYYQ